MMTCEFCGVSIPTTVAYCPACGVNLRTGLEPTPSRLSKPPKASREHQKNDAGWGWLGLVFSFWIIWNGCKAVWHSKLRYMIQYQVGSEQVLEDIEPHNCDWFTAPIGSKRCHYEVRVQPTWVQGVPPPDAKVLVSWEKIDK